MTLSFDQSIPKKSIEQVSIQKNLLKICLTLLKYEDALAEVSARIEEPERDIRQEKNVNHIHKR